VRRHAPGCNGTVIAFSCTVVYPLCGCGVLWTCGAGTNVPFFAAFSLARNTTSPSTGEHEQHLERLGRHESNGTE
jgi:hypothetical protein